MADKKAKCKTCGNDEANCGCKDEKNCNCSDCECEEYYDENILILDNAIEGIIHQIKEAVKDNNFTSDELHELTKNLKNLSAAKKNILKSDLLSIELDDCLYDDLEDDLVNDEPEADFEEDEEVIVEPEKKEIKNSKKSKK